MMWISPLVATQTKAFAVQRIFNALYNVGNAHGYLEKTGGTTSLAYSLAGRLVAAKSGWLLLEVPIALVRGAFDALHEVGAEFPPPCGDASNYKAHISVMRPEEVTQAGGLDKITERGHYFHYTLGQLRSVEPAGWKEMSKVWFIQIKSPELEKFRKSYGLTALPHDNEFEFHITVAVRRKHVLKENDVAKAASVAEVVREWYEAGTLASKVYSDKFEDWIKAALDSGAPSASLTPEAAEEPTPKVPSDDPEVVIDRPKGFKKTFKTSGGDKELTYPLDYGYFKGQTNPQDKEDADVFMGTGGPHYGKFMKGNMTTGTWQPDEHKWYHGLHDHELKSLQDWWATQHDPGLTRDWTNFPDRNALLADVRNLGAPPEAALAQELNKQAKHHSMAGTKYDGDKKVAVCPHCDCTLDAKDVYTDKKGWKFCRKCFRFGHGSIRLPTHFEEGKEAAEAPKAPTVVNQVLNKVPMTRRQALGVMLARLASASTKQSSLVPPFIRRMGERYYEPLAKMYGPKWAKAILGAGAIGLPLPIPGSTALTALPAIAGAELTSGMPLTRKLLGDGPSPAMAQLGAILGPQRGDEFSHFMKGSSAAPVQHERQQHTYGCGAAALKSVENTMGTGHTTQTAYESESKTTPEKGTPVVNMEATAARHGLVVNSRKGMTMADIVQATTGGKPVIVAVQMDGEGGGPANGWEAGHYIVVTGVQNGHVTFMDPGVWDNERAWPIETFMSRWHDYDHKGEIFNQWGMTLSRQNEVKQASTRFVREIQEGNLSPTAIEQGAAAMEPGKFRTIKPLGHGALNLAELVAGNVADKPGLLVRKQPLRQPTVPMQQWYQPLVDASKKIEKILPGESARYLAATPKGVFQEFGNKDLSNRPDARRRFVSPMDTEMGLANPLAPSFFTGQDMKGWMKGDVGTSVNPVQVRRSARFEKLLNPYGFYDMHPVNVSAGGQLLDFAYPRGGGAASNNEGFKSPPIPQVQEAIPKVNVQGGAAAPHLKTVAQRVNQYYNQPAVKSMMQAPPATSWLSRIPQAFARLFGKQSAEGSLGSGATAGPATDPPRLMDASGTTPAGAENQPASDSLAAFDQEPDGEMFDVAGLSQPASSQFGPHWSDRLRMMVEAPGYQDSSSIGAGGLTHAPSAGSNVTGDQFLSSTGGLPAQPADEPKMQLDSTTPETGQLPHLNP